jgi:hypothetical protein
MAANAINSATSPALALQQSNQTRQADAAKLAAAKSAAAKSAAEPAKAAKAKQVPEPQAQKTERPRPVTNTQGQRTGTVVNTTA